MATASPESTTRRGVTGVLDEDGVGEPSAKRQKRNTNDHPTSSQGGNRRQAACQPCRLRKVRCDKKRPACGLCRLSGQQCEYIGEANEKLSLETATVTLLERFGELRQEFETVKNVLHHQGLAARVHASSDIVVHENPIDLSRTLPFSASIEASRDFLQIPPHRASADAVLQWAIFEGNYPAHSLIGGLFSPEHNDVSFSTGTAPNLSGDLITNVSGLNHLEEERIPGLIDRFLQNVHTKNPILDVEALVKHGRTCAKQGVGWDGRSCLVLIACALGAVAKPFDMSFRPVSIVTSPISETGPKSASTESSSKLYAKELQQGDCCFTLACRRLGSLKYSMLGAQCHFFAGVYLMYTLRPMLSWHYFLHASIFCQMHLKMIHGLSGNFNQVLGDTYQHFTSADRKSRRLEQSLYWSCFKSECEFRVELPLQQSEICLGEYPDLFPSPPSPMATDQQGPPQSASRYDESQSFISEASELRRHVVRLCNEEESWYYYLTEIALRRIGNRILNTFFRQDKSSWLNIKPLFSIAQEFEAQVSSWSAHLPPAMQHYETTFIIRAPDSTVKGAGSHVSRELSWAIDNRLLEMQTWLYQPFLYYLIHAGAEHTVDAVGITTATSQQPQIGNMLNSLSPSTLGTSPGSAGITGASPLNTDDLTVLHSLISSGIECLIKTIDVRSCVHRHHGLWYDLRSIMCASLTLLAVVKSGNAAWIPGGTEALWGQPSSSHYWTEAAAPVGGKIANILRQFDFWAGESPDLLRYKEVLVAVVRDVRGS